MRAKYVLIALFLVGCATVEPDASGADQADAPSATDAGPPALSNSAAYYANYLRDSRLIPIGNGRALNLYCRGSGAPTVILEAGLGGFAYDWRAVQERIAVNTRVCAYDRAGMGRSPIGPMPRDTRAQVADLEALLASADVPGPYVLVGHSAGGYNVRVFASRHLGDVAGIVMVDPSVVNQLPRFVAALPNMAGQADGAISYARACADPARSAETAENCTRAAPEDFPEDLARTFVASQGLDQARTFQSEIEAFINVDSDQVEAEGRSLGAIPLIVLTRGERSTNMTEEQADTELRLWNELHTEVARLSSRGSHRIVQGAGHYIQLDQPDAVVGAVLEVVEQARGH
ncbi:MAG: alpha/beta hydrolase [Hyphomonadaceae bacterium]